jgi:hypothetical protein
MRRGGVSTLPHPGTGTSSRRRASRLVIGLTAMLLPSVLLPSGSALAAEQAAKKPAKEEGGIKGPTFVRMAPIVLPIFNKENKVTRQAGLVLALELEPGKTEADLEPNQRKLRDAFITDLYTLYDQAGNAEHVIDVALIKQRLQETSDRVLGAGFVHSVLIQQAFERARR